MQFINIHKIAKCIIYPVGKKYMSTILGIETSCDDTGCAIVNEKGNILGASLYSQSIVHLRYGGVNPLIARDLHRENIEIVVNKALDEAKLNIKDIDAIAVTIKPGLLISLQIGVKYAIYLSRTYNKVLIPIHHMEAHALVARMFHEISFPFLTLLISGGNSLLALVKDVNDFLLLGDTLDNAPGEVLDKAARRMKLRNIPAYSKLAGGQAIEMAARLSTNPYLFKFPLPLVRNRDCCFSFSGLKDAFRRHLLHQEKEHNIVGDRLIPEINDLCAGFQLAITEHLGHRTERAILFCEKHDLLDKNQKTVVVSGGVACNNFIFEGIQFIGNKLGCNVYRPPPKVCTDNGIMIAWNGIEKIKQQSTFESITLKDIDPTAPLGTNIMDEVKAANLNVKITRIKIK
ncbi:tRNA N6-adenosine threonylcarbamoyltransferase, mitochondrial [Bicyclus anynana]|uniref:N(6)-L-threonylcarbamoyladenine synthase n=1 Tax=Bicyclus anynana TaxID=110368 RepID=A0A6J1P240_BICAN|nr:tRNA N6-adenosine threonylcarbamoyltransferase, mitochondrial [Bicyclus anynana]